MSHEIQKRLIEYAKRSLSYCRLLVDIRNNVIHVVFAGKFVKTFRCKEYSGEVLFDLVVKEMIKKTPTVYHGLKEYKLIRWESSRVIRVQDDIGTVSRVTLDDMTYSQVKLLGLVGDEYYEYIQKLVENRASWEVDKEVV